MSEVVVLDTNIVSYLMKGVLGFDKKNASAPVTGPASVTMSVDQWFKHV